MMRAATAPIHDDELDLARRCADGDRRAQVDFFRENKSRVHATLYRILGSNRDMEDLIQESFLQIFRSMHSYRGEAKLATWVSRVAARVAFAYLSRRRVPTVALESVAEAPSGDEDAERQAVSREAVRRLYGILDRVEPKQRIAFALHVIDGRSLKEVASITESSLVATKTRVWRARRELARRARKDALLSDYLQDDMEFDI